MGVPRKKERIKKVKIEKKLKIVKLERSVKYFDSRMSKNTNFYNFDIIILIGFYL